MEFFHTRVYLRANQVARLDCDTQCNFRIFDDINFAMFQNGAECRGYGGFFTHFPARIPAPHAGHWNLVLDLGGASAMIRHRFSVE